MLWLLPLVVSLSGCLRLPRHPDELPATETAPAVKDAATTLLSTRTPAPAYTPTVTPLPHYMTIQPEDLVGLNLVVWHAQRDAVRETLEEFTAQFNEENPYGLTVSLHADVSEDEMDAGLLAQPANSHFPQIIIAESPRLKKWQSQDLPMVMLKNYMDHPRWGFAAQQIEPVLSSMLAQEFWQGNLTTLPLWHNPDLLVYNNAFGQILGFREAPESLEALETQICAAWKFIREDDDPSNDGTGGWILNRSAGSLISWLLSRNGEQLDLSVFPEGAFGEQFVETLSWLRGLFDQGCVWQSRLSDPYDYFSGHSALVYSGSFADIKAQRNSFSREEQNKLDDWMLIPYPAAEEEGASTRPLVFSNAVSAGIFTGSAEEQMASWVFLSWLMGEERAASLALKADAWPVQESDKVDLLFKMEGDPKIYPTLKWRANIFSGGLPAAWRLPGWCFRMDMRSPSALVRLRKKFRSSGSKFIQH